MFYDFCRYDREEPKRDDSYLIIVIMATFFLALRAIIMTISKIPFSACNIL